jgi:hypothetical protein
MQLRKRNRVLELGTMREASDRWCFFTNHGANTKVVTAIENECAVMRLMKEIERESVCTCNEQVACCKQRQATVPTAASIE